MTIQETEKILAILYSLWRSNESPDDLERECRVWQWAFKNDQYKVVEIGVQLWIRGGNAFMPKPSQIREILAKRSCNIIPEEEWQIVASAMSRHSRGLDTPGFKVDENDRGIIIPPPIFHHLTQKAIDTLGERYLRNETESQARKDFIFTLRKIIENHVESLTYGDSPLELVRNEARSLPQDIPFILEG